jgi:hypothetical protein
MPDELHTTSFKDWVAQAISNESSPATRPQWGLCRLTDEKKESLINDISDVYEDLGNSFGLFEELRLEEPDTDKLEKVLVDVEIGLAHAVHHWRRALGSLQADSLWMEDDFFDRHSL